MAVQTVRVVNGLVLLATLVIMIYVVTKFVGMADIALYTADQRGSELMAASERAERAVEAERLGREREELAASQLRQAVAQYVGFLERVSSGDYEARLELDKVALGKHAEELRILGKYLNTTVEILVKSVTDIQAIQSRYLGETWQGYLDGGAIQREFHYPRQPQDPEPGNATVTAMAQAVSNRDLVIGDGDLAVPISWGGTILGAIAVRRQSEHGWSEQDLAMVGVVAEQLAQTIENLRLLDETQRNAAREQLIGEVTARMRESLDLETMLRRAADEMRRALGLERVLVRLATAERVPEPGPAGRDA
jgi:hypothetical protein